MRKNEEKGKNRIGEKKKERKEEEKKNFFFFRTIFLKAIVEFVFTFLIEPGDRAFMSLLYYNPNENE